MDDIIRLSQMMAENQNKLKQLYSNIELNSALRSINNTMQMLKPHYALVDNAMNHFRNSMNIAEWSNAMKSISNINNQLKMMMDLGIRNDQFKSLIPSIPINQPKSFEIQPLTDLLDVFEEIEDVNHLGSNNNEVKIDYIEIREKLNNSPSWTIVFFILTSIIIPMLVNILTPNPTLDQVSDKQDSIIEQQAEQIELLRKDKELLMNHIEITEEQMNKIEQSNDKILELLRKQEEINQDIR